jgi:hypothetical protein
VTDDEIIGLFLRSLNVLHVVDDRVQLDPLTFKDLDTIARLCFATETISSASSSGLRHIDGPVLPRDLLAQQHRCR